MQGAVELILPGRSSKFQSLPDEDRPGSPELRSKWRSEGAAEMARAVERLMFMRGSRGESGPLAAAYTETSGGDGLLVSGWLRFREPQTLERYLDTDIYRDDLMLTLVSWACAVGVRAEPRTSAHGRAHACVAPQRPGPMPGSMCGAPLGLV